MHELSIVQDLLQICALNAAQKGATKISRVEVKIGRLSGVEPHYLKSTFDAFKEGGICADAQLVLESQDIVVECEDCGYKGSIAPDEFICPKCSSKALRVVEGEDLMLVRLEMENELLD